MPDVLAADTALLERAGLSVRNGSLAARLWHTRICTLLFSTAHVSEELTRHSFTFGILAFGACTLHSPSFGSAAGAKASPTHNLCPSTAHASGNPPATSKSRTLITLITPIQQPQTNLRLAHSTVCRLLCAVQAVKA
jgi:hypothetical protein